MTNPLNLDNPLAADDLVLCDSVLDDLISLARQIADKAHGEANDGTEKMLHDVNAVLGFTERQASTAPVLLAVALLRLANTREVDDAHAKLAELAHTHRRYSTYAGGNGTAVDYCNDHAGHNGWTPYPCATRLTVDGATAS